MSKTSSKRSAVELAGELEKLQLALSAKEEEGEQLKEGLAAAELAGEAAIEAHEAKAKTWERQMRSLRAQLQDIERQRDEAMERELHDGIRARHKRALEKTTKLQPEYEQMNEEQKRHCELLACAMLQQNENEEINRLIRQHRLEIEMLPHVEGWRHEPAIAATYEQVEVEKDIAVPTKIGGTESVVIETMPALRKTERRTVIERRIVSPAKAAFVPRPLWDCFSVPGLRRNDPALIVAGSRGLAWWMNAYGG
jgi:hypothetical protein